MSVGFRQRASRVGMEIEFFREFTDGIDLGLGHRFEVEVESFKDDDQLVGELLDGLSLQSRHFLITSLAEVRVISIQHFALNE